MLHYAMKESGLFPDLIIQMVAIGEYAGSLDVMFDRAATYFEEMVEHRVDEITRLIEPIIVALLGGVVGSFFTVWRDTTLRRVK